MHITTPTLPKLHPVHIKHLRMWKHFHWLAQFSYLVTEFSGHHLIHTGCTVAVVLGMALFFISGQEVEGV